MRSGSDSIQSDHDLGIAVQHQPVGAHFPAFQPIQKTHAEQIDLHLSARHHECRYRAFDQLADRKPVERQPGRPGMSAGGLDVDVIFEQLQRQPGSLDAARLRINSETVSLARAICSGSP